jgi:hypothetical protein
VDILVSHGLDDGALALFGRAAHDIDTNRHHIARAQVAHLLIEPGRADDIGKQYG